ncbi:MAG TPA: hypothetical protein VE575_10720 [Acidimicrobiales bacterium]|nr:hypothetical protein [Acidimicrobiales bacterium]
MTPEERRWTEVAEFDPARARRLWAGTLASEDAPAWYGPMASLVRSARGPGTTDELAAEDEVVARMRAVIDHDGRRVGSPAHMAGPPASAAPTAARAGRVAGRIVAAKAAAVTTVVALGVTAAAATTGIVATVVVPAITDRDRAVEEEQAPSAETGDTSADGIGATAGEEPRDRPGAVPAPGADGGPPGDPGATGPDDAGADSSSVPAHATTTTAAEAEGSGDATTSSSTPASTTTTTTTTSPPASSTTTTQPPSSTTTTTKAPSGDEGAAASGGPGVEPLSAPGPVDGRSNARGGQAS